MRAGLLFASLFSCLLLEKVVTGRVGGYYMVIRKEGGIGNSVWGLYTKRVKDVCGLMAFLEFQHPM